MLSVSLLISAIKWTYNFYKNVITNLVIYASIGWVYRKIGRGGAFIENY